MSLTNRCRITARRWALQCLAWSSVLLGTLTAAQAQTVPKANDSITNTATASFRDSAGQVLTVNSNPVSTTVLQVGAYALTPEGTITKSGARDATVYFPYTLTNKGNGTDAFTISVEPATTTDFARIAVFQDNGQGQPSSTTPLCAYPVETGIPDCRTSVAGYEKTLDAGQSVNLLIAYKLPSNADSNWNQKSTTVTLRPKAGTTWLTTYPEYDSSNNTSAKTDRTNTVVFSNSAIFNVTKALSAPAFLQPGGAAWPVAAEGPRPSSGLGIATTYTLTYRNTGAAAGTLYIKDALPSGLTYKAGSAVISCAPTTNLNDNPKGTNDSSDQALCNSIGIEYEYDSNGKTIYLRVPGVAPNTQGTVSFIVQINSTAGTSAGDTTNVATYSTGDTGGDENTNTPETSGSGKCDSLSECKTQTFPGKEDTTTPDTGKFVIKAVRKVTLNVQDTTEGTPDSNAGDTVTTAKLAPRVAGRQVHTITNTGDQSDTFNMTVDNTGTNKFPDGTTFVWKFADSSNQPTSALTDTNNDGIVDTGVIAAGATMKLILEITLPEGTPVAAGKNYQAIAQAKSINYTLDNKARDTSYVKATDVVGGLVDLTGKNYASPTPADVGAGPGPGQTPDAITPTIVAGSAVHQILLSVTNNESAQNSYDVSYSANSSFNANLPGGWRVVLSSSACSAPTALTGNNTGNVSANGGTQQFYVCVYSPNTSSTINQPIYIKVEGKNTPAQGQSKPVDVIYYQVSVVAENGYRFDLTSRGDTTVQGGGSTVFTYNLSNTGTNSCGVGSTSNGNITGNYFKLTVTLPTTLYEAGWRLSVYKDKTGSGTPGSLDVGDESLTLTETKSAAVTYDAVLGQNLGSGSSQTFFVKLNAPDGVTVGSQAGISIKVADVNSSGVTQLPPAGCGEQGFESKTTVSSGVVKLDTYQISSSDACVGTGGVAQTMPADTSASWTQQTSKVMPGGCIFYKVVATNTSANVTTDLKIVTTAPNFTTLVDQAKIAATCTSTNMGASDTVAPVVAGSQVSCGAGAGTGNTTTNSLNPSGTVTLKYAVSVNK